MYLLKILDINFSLKAHLNINKLWNFIGHCSFSTWATSNPALVFLALILSSNNHADENNDTDSLKWFPL